MTLGARKKPGGQVHGVLLINKPEGPTSHDIVSRCRRIFGTRRVGHAGTLDPMATGVLVVLLGEATKLSSVLTRARKTYETEVLFGSGTDTLDRLGKQNRYKDLPADFPQVESLRAALERELLREVQVPPNISAIKVDGQRAYALARAGEELDLAPRRVFVHGLTLLGTGERRIRAILDVSKGYYVRAFARDLGESLDAPAHLTDLKRTASGPFTLSECSPWPPEETTPLLTLEEAVRRSLPVLELIGEGPLRAIQGKILRPEDFGTSPLPWEAPDPAAPESDEGYVAAFDAGRLVALLQPVDIPEHFRVRRGIDAGRGA